MAESVAPTRCFAGASKNTGLLAFTSFFADISTEMLYLILPIFLTQTLHANGSVVGLVEGIAQSTQNIVQGFSGWLSDRLQKRRIRQPLLSADERSCSAFLYDGRGRQESPCLLTLERFSEWRAHIKA